MYCNGVNAFALLLSKLEPAGYGIRHLDLVDLSNLTNTTTFP